MAWGNKPNKPESTATEKEMKRKLQKGIDKLKGLAPLPQTQQIYRYLAKVYLLGRTLPLNNNKKTQEALMALVPNIRMKGGFNRFRALVELTAHESTNKKLRGRYGRALQSAHKMKVPASNFVHYVKSNGGVNKLGDQKLPKATHQKKKPVKKPVKKSAPSSGKDDWS